MKTKKKPEGKVPVSLYFDDSTFVAKLVRRVSPGRFKQAGDIVERAFFDVFDSGFSHKSGTPTWSKEGADPDRADQVSARLSLHDDVLSITYKRPPTVTIPTGKRGKDIHYSAICVLKERLKGLAVEMDASKGTIANTDARLDAERALLAALERERDRLEETIKALGG